MKFIALASLLLAAVSVNAQTVLLAGWDFDTGIRTAGTVNINDNPAVIDAQLGRHGYQTPDIFTTPIATIDTTSFRQPADDFYLAPGQDLFNRDFNAQTVNFREAGGEPNLLGEPLSFYSYEMDNVEENGRLEFRGDVNGQSFTFTFTTAGYENIAFQFDTKAFSDAFLKTNTVEISYNGGSSYVALESDVVGSAWATNSYSLADAANLSSVMIRYTIFTDETAQFESPDGLGFDNIAVFGTLIPEPSTTSALAGLAVVALVVARRRRA